MWRRGSESDLDREIANRRVSTRRHVSVGDPASVGDPVVSTTQGRSVNEGGFVDETRVRQATCCSCRRVLREDMLGAVCVICRRVLCPECAGRRCASCGASVCLRRSVTLGGKTRCRRHFWLRALGWVLLLISVAVAVLYLAADAKPVSGLGVEFRSFVARLLAGLRQL